MRSFIAALLLLVSNTTILSQEIELIWQDEFKNSSTLDLKKWNYETGFVRNLEKQIYTRRRSNIKIKKGKLYITAKKEKYPNNNFNKDSSNWRFRIKKADYTSASINTKNKFEFQYGRVDVRAKLPEGNGVWPAIWMLGADFDEISWPESGEIDIMEHVGKVPDEIHGTLHYPYDNHNGYTSNGNSVKVNSPEDNFHIYSIQWDPEKIEWLVDNKSYHCFKLDDAGLENNPFRKPFYLILNLALGGTWAGEVNPDIFPQSLIIDFIRVYKIRK